MLLFHALFSLRNGGFMEYIMDQIIALLKQMQKNRVVRRER